MPRAPLSRAIYSNFASQGVAAALAFLLSPLLVSGLGVARYGAWALVAEILAYYLMLDFGVRGAVAHFVARHLATGDEIRANKTLATAFWILLPIGILAGLFGCGLAYFLPELFGMASIDRREIFIAMSVMAWTIGLSLPMEIFSAALRGGQRLDLVNAVEVVGQLFGGLAMFLVLRQGGGLIALALSQGSARLLRWILSAILTSRTIHGFSIRPHNISRTESGGLLRLGGRKIAIDIAQLISTRTDLLVVGSFLGVQWVAFYSLARLVPQQISAMNLSITQAFTPWLTELHARVKSDDLRRSFLFGSSVSMLFSFLGAVCVIGFVHYFLQLWVGAQFVAGELTMRSDTVAVILMLALLPGMMQSTSSQLIFAAGQHGFLARLRSIEAAANIALSLLLVERLGLAGVAIGTLVPAVLSQLIFVPRFISREFGISSRDWYLSVLLRPCVAAIALAAVVMAVLAIREPLSWPVFFAETAVVACSAALIGATMGLRADQRSAILRRLPIGLARAS